MDRLRACLSKPLAEASSATRRVPTLSHVL
ncbi:hypothetical protein LINPERPRIM_LOCUS18876 [Linum perenne]